MEQVVELLKDQVFMDELVKLEDEKDVINLFASRGVTVTMEELQKLFDQAPEDEEMSEDDLQKVSGGVIMWTIGTCIPSTTFTVRTATTFLTTWTPRTRRW